MSSAEKYLKYKIKYLDLQRTQNLSGYDQPQINTELFSVLDLSDYSNIIKKLVNILETITDSEISDIINFKNKCTGESILLLASQKGYTEIVKLLLDKGANPNISNSGNTSLIRACNSGYTDIVKLLLDKGADYNITDVAGYNPLCIACNNGYTDIVKLLLDNGASPNISKNGKTALIRAYKSGCTEIIKLLLENGADYKYI